MSRLLDISTARAFVPLLRPARYKAAFGGRGSAKTHFFGELLVEDCMIHSGMRAVCIREVQRTLTQSSKALIESKIETLGLTREFDIQRELIKTPGDGVIIFQGMQNHTAESIKSLEGFGRAWVDEAQSLSDRSLSLLRPTIRIDDSEIWFSWNPRRKKDAVDYFFRGNSNEEARRKKDNAKEKWSLPPGAVVVQANWRDNPWWNATLEAERQLELSMYPERYEHTYEGGYAKAFEGAYFAKLLAEAKLKGRIGTVSADPLLPLRAFHDIGGSSATADAYTIWIVQWVDQKILILDYYESVGQVLAHHVNWMRQNDYENAINYLPHDGVNENNVTGKRYEDHWRDAGFKVEPSLKNQGKGASSMRIEAVRRLGPKMWWNESTTEAGRDAIGFYHEKKDENRDIGLGPDHDWSSHAADSLGAMALAYEDPERSAGFGRKIVYLDNGYA